MLFRSLEEERRLAHVGLTRARKRAFISFAANRRIHNLWQSSVPSRFVAELPAEHVEMASAPGLWGAASPAAARQRQSRFDGFAETKPRASAAIAPGNRVFHQKFGYGRVLAAESGKLDIEFEHAGRKKVMDSFVEPA